VSGKVFQLEDDCFCQMLPEVRAGLWSRGGIRSISPQNFLSPQTLQSRKICFEHNNRNKNISLPKNVLCHSKPQNLVARMKQRAANVLKWKACHLPTIG